MIGLGVGAHTETNFHFSPPDIANLAVWYKYDTGITESSSKCSQWDDQSGNGNNATQGTGSKQPEVTGVGDRTTGGALEFDGTDDLMNFTKATMSANHNTLIGVVIHAKASSSEVILADTNSEFFRIDTSKKLAVKSAGVKPLMINTGATNLFDDAAGVQSLVISRNDGSTGTWKFYRNGIDTEDLSGFDSFSNQTNAAQIDFDILGGGATNGFFTGPIYEIIVYDLGTGTATAQEIRDLNDYLTGKFGIGDQHAR